MGSLGKSWRRLSEWRAAIARVRGAYRAFYGRAPRLVRPRLYSEKMQWRKLFDLDPRFALLSDKLAARSFIADAVGWCHLPELMLVADDPETIALEALDPPYVLKSTHASGHVLRVPSDAAIDAGAARALMRNWLTSAHDVFAQEPGYWHVPRRIIAERMITNADGSAPLERRMFVFGGRVRLTQTIMVEGNALRIAAYHDRDWRRLPWRGKSEPHPGPFPRPQRYDELIALAERAGAGFDHARVDLYDADARPYVGEVTLYTLSGFLYFATEEPDRVLGRWWRIERPALRALGTLMRRRYDIPRPAAARGLLATETLPAKRPRL